VTLCLASALPLRVVQVGFVRLWFELNIGIGWHGLALTIFNPSGMYVYPVLLPTPPMLSVDPGFRSSAGLAALNVAVLLGTTAASVALTGVSLAVRQRRQAGT